MKQLFASESMSAIMTENDDDGPVSRKFYSWGDSDLMSCFTKSHQPLGSSSHTFSSCSAHKYGAYSLGGQAKSIGGLQLLDQRMDAK